VKKPLFFAGFSPNDTPLYTFGKHHLFATSSLFLPYNCPPASPENAASFDRQMAEKSPKRGFLIKKAEVRRNGLGSSVS
jgi:hypothetical protein